MAEARSSFNFDLHRVQVDGTVGGYEVRQLPNGEAGFRDASTGGISGDYLDFRKRGRATVEKTASIVFLKGCRVYWDHSANKAHIKKVNDRDFYMGRCAEDATSAALTVEVDLNADPPYDIDVARDGFLSVPVGTQGLNTMGVFRRGGSHHILISATNEAQKLDILSVDGFATGANAIIEAIFRVASDGAGTVVDVSIGAANGTHATDFDSVTESLLVHLDANNTNINLESDDGSTEVAATDSTIDYTEGSAVANRVQVWFDMRDPADVQIYINGVLALSSTVFAVNAAAGPWFLVCHIEKTSSTDTYELALDALRCWFAEQ